MTEQCPVDLYLSFLRLQYYRFATMGVSRFVRSSCEQVTWRQPSGEVQDFLKRARFEVTGAAGR